MGILIPNVHLVKDCKQKKNVNLIAIECGFHANWEEVIKDRVKANLQHRLPCRNARD